MTRFATRCWLLLDGVPVLARWLAVAVWALLIFVLSAQPGLRVSADPGVDGPTRHLAHVACYALLTGLIGWALAGHRTPTPRIALAAALLALLYGVTDEWHQTFVPSRTGRPEDLIWDGIGAAFGLVALSLVWRDSRRTG